MLTASSYRSAPLRPPTRPPSNYLMKLLSAAFAVCVIFTLVTFLRLERDDPTDANVAVGDPQLLVFLANEGDDANHVAQKNLEDLKNQEKVKKGIVKIVAATPNEQQRMVERTCPDAVTAFDKLVEQKQEHLATELWKYCILSRNDGPTRLFIDANSPLLVRLVDLMTLAAKTSNLAAINEDYFAKTVHGSLMLIQPGRHAVPKKMLSLLTESTAEELALDPLLLPKTLYEYIAAEASERTLTLGHNGNWYLLEQVCSLSPLQANKSDSWETSNTYRLNHCCPLTTGFCCAVRNGLETTILLTRHPILPYQTISQEIPRPYNAEAGHYSEEDLPYIATIREKVFSKPSGHPRTPNFFDILMENDCLPDGATCSKCLRDKSGASCKSCAKECPCYCKALCREEPEKKFLAKELTVVPPRYSRNPNRLVPRIIHQTYFEELTKEKYPNMSRLVESLKRSGWDYRFYSDDDARNFLSTHFPAEVREAYDALRPGAFKADLFRYCALLIHGGAYFDVDIMLGKTDSFCV